MEKGTLFQLKNALNRSSVPSDPVKNPKSSEDFLELVLVAHVILAARQLMKEDSDRYSCVHKLSEAVVDRFVELGDTSERSGTDKIRLYATEVLTLGLLWYSFCDAIKEGDGERVIQLWKFFLVAFKASGHRNYAKEAMTLLLQVKYKLSERKVSQFTWGRFINTHGRKGCNIPCDLHMEHLNRRYKSIVLNLGANQTKAAMRRASRCISIVHHVCQTMESEFVGKHTSDHHPIPHFGKDLTVALDVIAEAEVFTHTPNRQHHTFKFKNLYEAYNEEKLLEWLFQQISETIV